MLHKKSKFRTGRKKRKLMQRENSKHKPNQTTKSGGKKLAKVDERSNRSNKVTKLVVYRTSSYFTPESVYDSWLEWKKSFRQVREVQQISNRYPCFPNEVALFTPSIPKLRQVLDAIAFIPSCLSDDQMVQFMCAEPILEETITLMKNHYQRKLAFPEIFNDRNPEGGDIAKARTTVTVAPFPVYSKEGYLIVYVALGATEVSAADMQASCKLLGMAVESLLLSFGLSPGYIIIFDLTNITSEHFRPQMIPHLRGFLEYIQNGSPLKIKKIFVINRRNVWNGLETYKNVLPLLYRNTISKICYDEYYLNKLHSELTINRLPSDFGGKYASLTVYADVFFHKIKSHADWFKKEEMQRTNISQTAET